MPLIGVDNWSFNRRELYVSPAPETVQGNRTEILPPAPKVEVIETEQMFSEKGIPGSKIGPIYDTGNAGITSIGETSDDVRFWAGSTFANRATAPFRVTRDGHLYASAATIPAPSTIAGFDVGADYIRDAANSMGLASTVTVGDDVRFWAGSTFANRATAPFRVTESGVVNATSVTVTGTINAIGGYIGTGTALIYESTGINTGTTGHIRGGQTDYNTGTGYFLGYANSTYQFSIGDGGTSQYLTWDGTTLVVNGFNLAREDILGDGSDGAVIVSTNTTLTRDMFYSSLTVNNGVTLNCGSYRVLCTGTITNNGTIQRNGVAGGNGGDGGNGVYPTIGTAGAAGAAGTALASGSLPGSIAGQIGTAGSTGATAIPSGAVNASPATTVAGTNGTNSAKSLGNDGVAGVTGKTGGTATAGTVTGNAGMAGIAGIAGVKTGTIYNVPKSLIAAYNLFDVYPSFDTFRSSAGSGGSTGSGGGAASVNNSSAPNAAGGGGAGAGGGGSAAGFVFIAAKTIINNGIISATGGKGGDGGDGGNGNIGGSSVSRAAAGGAPGSGGPGASGGVIFLIAGSYTNNGTVSVAGGVGGTKGIAGTGAAADGGSVTAPADANNGINGLDGTIILLQL